MRFSATKNPSRRLVQERQPAREESADSTSFAALFAFAQEEEKAGRRASARSAYEQALLKAETSDESSKISSIIRWIARTHLMDGDSDAALECLEAALAIAETNNDDASAGNAINLQGNVAWQLGDLD